MWAEKVASKILERKEEVLEEVRKLLRMPSVSGTGEGIEDVASYLRDWIEGRIGARAQLLRYGGHPIVYAKLDAGKDRTLLFYNMYDVQPPGPPELWEAPPFEAKIVVDSDGRLEILARCSATIFCIDSTSPCASLTSLNVMPRAPEGATVTGTVA